MLDLANNKIENIEAVKELTALTMLDLANNKIENIEAVKELTALTTLYLYNNKIENIEAVKELTALTTLDLHNNKINNWELLLELKSIRSLGIDSEQAIAKKGFFETLPTINHLHIVVLRPQYTLDFLRQYPVLHGITLENYTQEEVLQVLHAFPNLTTVNLRRILTDDWLFLTKFPQIQILDVSHNKIPIVILHRLVAELPNLKRFYIHDTQENTIEANNVRAELAHRYRDIAFNSNSENHHYL
jgi:Leucine-rich repeat (LRR) protein